MGFSPVFWLVFSLAIVSVMALDLGVFNRHSHKISFKEAGIWAMVWISLALLFDGFLFFKTGAESGMIFLTGYLVELSLSVDNLFVMLLVFQSFRVPAMYQHKALFWGILGAIVLRGIFIATGITLIHYFQWLIYVFGIFLVVTGIKLGFSKDEKEEDLSKHPVVRFSKKVIPVTHQHSGDKFFIKENARWVATPLFLVVVVINLMDILFATDSIPAILAITTDPFLVYTSNIFAIIGLRSMFFLLSGLMEEFHHLKKGLAVILAFIGVKMLMTDFYKISTAWALGVIAFILAASILASRIWPQPEAKDKRTQSHS